MVVQHQFPIPVTSLKCKIEPDVKDLDKTVFLPLVNAVSYEVFVPMLQW